jgi:hypothetical protein
MTAPEHFAKIGLPLRRSCPQMIPVDVRERVRIGQDVLIEALLH